MADLGIARLSNEAGREATLTRADLADVVASPPRPVARRIASVVERVLHHMCHALVRRSERQDLRLRQLHPARQGRAGRAQSQDRGRGSDRAAPGHDLPRQPDHARQDRENRHRHGEPATKARALSARSANCRSELGVAQHILRYWETKFPQLKPLQRAGNRRYYRPAMSSWRGKIHRLLNKEGYTVRGVQKLLRNGVRTERRRMPVKPARCCASRSRRASAGASPASTCSG